MTNADQSIADGFCLVDYHRAIGNGYQAKNLQKELCYQAYEKAHRSVGFVKRKTSLSGDSVVTYYKNQIKKED